MTRPEELSPEARARLIVQALDPQAKINYSENTDRFYVATRLNVTDGRLVKGLAVHAVAAPAAWVATLQRMLDIGEDESIVRDGAPRREWRWNGAAFAEIERKATR